jgi:magnesium transporter
MPENSQMAEDRSAIIALRAYCPGRAHRSLDIEQISHVLTEDKTLVWIGLKDPSDELIARIANQLHLDTSLLEDLMSSHQMAKVVDYDAHIQIVAMTVEIDPQNGTPVFGETQMIVGRKFLLTIRRGAVAPYSGLRQRLEYQPDRLARGSDYVVAELLDFMIDRYAVAYESIDKTIEEIEEKLIVGGLDAVGITRLYQIRRDFQRIHNAISPLGEVCLRLSRLQMEPIDEVMRPHFGDLADRVSRVDRLLDGLGEELAFAFEAGMLIEQSRQTDTTRKLAAWAAILAIPTAIAGIYGMNFEEMPELKWQYGYPTVIGSMFAICGFLYYRLKKAKWL